MKKTKRLLAVGISLSMLLGGISIGTVTAENAEKTVSVKQDETLVSYDFSSEPQGMSFKLGSGQSSEISEDGRLKLTSGSTADNTCAVEFDLGTGSISPDGSVYEISYDFNVSSCGGWDPSILLIASDSKINGITDNGNFYGKAALAAMGNNGTSGFLGSFAKTLKPTNQYNAYATTGTTPKAEANFGLWVDDNWHNAKIIVDTANNTADYYYMRFGEAGYTYVGRQDASFFNGALSNGISHLQFELRANAVRTLSLDNLTVKKTINYTYTGLDVATDVNISGNTIEITADTAFAENAQISVVKEKNDANLVTNCVVSGNKITATLSEDYDKNFDYCVSGAVSGIIDKVKKSDVWTNVLKYDFNDGQTPDRVSYRGFSNNNTLTSWEPTVVNKTEGDETDKVLNATSLLNNSTAVIDINLLPDGSKTVLDPEIKPMAGKYSITYDMLLKNRNNWNPTIRLGASSYWDMADNWFIYKGLYDMHMNVVGSANTATKLSFAKSWGIDPYGSFATSPTVQKDKELGANTWVSCKMIVDTKNNRVDYYYKLPSDSDYDYVGSHTDMKLSNGMSYNSGIRHLELQVYSGDSSSYTVQFDNLSIDKVAPQEASVRFIGWNDSEMFPNATLNNPVKGIKVAIDGTYVNTDCYNNIVLKKDGTKIGILGSLENGVYTINPAENTSWSNGSYTLDVFGKEYTFTMSGQDKEIFSVRTPKLIGSDGNEITAVGDIEKDETITATVNVDKYNTDKTAVIMLAVYNGGTLTSVSVENLTETEKSVSAKVTDTTDLKVCIYCFDSFSTIKPQVEALVIDK